MGKMIDLTGQRFGRLVVIKKDEDAVKTRGAYWICKCDCGTEKSILSNALRYGLTQSCGCYNKEINSKPKEIQGMVGKRFGKLTVIRREGTHISAGGQKKPTWLCQCDCGNKTIVITGDLNSGHTKSCGCMPTKIRGDGLIDLTGKRFGKLVVIERADDYTYYNSAVPAWLCLCDCGNLKVVQGGNLRNGAVKHCGCDKQASKEENKVAVFLKDNNIKFMREYSFKDLIGRGGRRLRFDFGILDCDYNLLMFVEYQSEIHYREDCIIGKYQREYSDKAKKEYCKRKQIPLYEVKYDNVENDLNNLLDNIKNKNHM